MIEVFDNSQHYNLPYPNNNGDAILLPISCTVTARVNGTWELKLSHPLDDEGRWQYITINNVLRVPSHNGKQLFRIKYVEKTDSTVEATADPIAFDAGNDCFLQDVRPTSKTGQQALTAILAPNNKYTGVSDIATVSTAYYIRKNALEAISGSDESSFLNRWGGEIEYDNFTIKINSRLGSDNGVLIRTGKNLPRNGLKMTVDTSDTINRIVPLAYNGHGMSGGTPWVDAVIPAGVPISTGVVTFENIRLASDTGFSPGETIPDYITVCADQAALDTALAAAANTYFTETRCAESYVEIEADIAVLQALEEYKDFTGLEAIGLGDTVYLYNKRMGIGETSLGYSPQPARVMELEWDCIRNVAKRIIARTTTSSQTFSSEQVSVGGGSAPFQVDDNGNIVMGDKLIFGSSVVSVPTFMQHIYGNTNGGALLVRPGGPLVIGGGEYASNRWAEGDIAATNESARLGADSAVYIESNGNTIANRKTWTFDTSGNLTTPTGGLINNVDVTKIGEAGDGIAAGTSVSLASGTSWVNVGSITLTKGTWLMFATLAFASNATGRRSMCVSTTSTGQAGLGYQAYSTANATDGAVSILHCSRPIVVTASSTTYYMNAAQNSGGSLTVYPVIQTIRLA